MAIWRAHPSACCRGWRKRWPKKIWEVRSVGLKAVGKAGSMLVPSGGRTRMCCAFGDDHGRMLLSPDYQASLESLKKPPLKLNAALLDISCLLWPACIYNIACYFCCSRHFFVRHASAAVILSKVPTAKNALIALDYPLWYATTTILLHVPSLLIPTI
jgi:hypothetical protein